MIAMLRPFALTIPAVTVKLRVRPSPNPGFPTARTHCPISTSSLSPSGSVGSFCFASILITATSVVGSRPTSVAGNCRPSESSTRSFSARSTTWLFVRMYPSSETTKPDPMPRGTS